MIESIRSRLTKRDSFATERGTILLRRGIEAALFAMLASYIWVWVSGSLLHRSHPGTEPSINKSVSIPQRPTPSYDRLASMHIFGDAAPLQAAGDPPAAQMTDITVQGIVAGDSEQDSVALLSVDGNTSPYLIGQTLPDGEKVSHIEPSTVQLEKMGQTRDLELDIKFANADAVFRKAAFQDDGKDSWADAYLDESADKPANTGKFTGGIAIVPAASKSDAPAMSLKAIRAQRASHFSSFRSKPGTLPEPPNPNP